MSGQVFRYMDWVAGNMKQPKSVQVTGIIIAAFRYMGTVSVPHDLGSRLRPKEEGKIVRYMVSRSDWKGVSETER